MAFEFLKLKNRENRDTQINLNKDAFEVKSSKKAVKVLQDLFSDPIDDQTALEDIPSSRKRKSICLLFAFIGGVTGLHRLYLGHYKHFLIHLGAILFVYFSYIILPDNGLTVLTSLILLLWFLADILAIIFSKVQDGDKKFVDQW